MFGISLSWLEVGLQILRCGNWSPERSQCVDINFEKIVPPDRLLAHIFSGRVYCGPNRFFDRVGWRILAQKVQLIGAVISVDET